MDRRRRLWRMAWQLGWQPLLLQLLTLTLRMVIFFFFSGLAFYFSHNLRLFSSGFQLSLCAHLPSSFTYFSPSALYYYCYYYSSSPSYHNLDHNQNPPSILLLLRPSIYDTIPLPPLWGNTMIPSHSSSVVTLHRRRSSSLVD